MKPIKNWSDLERRFTPFIEKGLVELLPEKSSYTKKFDSALHYSLTSGGKRIRPLLFIAVFLALKKKIEKSELEKLIAFACGIEYIHNYSLVHDDIMDKDELRRGAETVWKKFGAETAILVGDALLTKGLGILYANYYSGALFLNRNVGAPGMISGQAADIECEGKSASSYGEDALWYIHGHKTAAFFSGVCGAAAVAAGQGKAILLKFADFGFYTGGAFQLTDDILDETGSAQYQKSRNDKRNEKLTALKYFSVGEAQSIVDKLSLEAENILLSIPCSRNVLKEIIDLLRKRKK
ncbi:MAG: hypothetical protein COT16_02550 [Elusimicrobia bacterium CG08_land_8_20_14_0_20_44_26]|nr:MAG: hypothetical protein COT16_02550 [Elusimicrobia bacterium CG08_land_8_20_14_0_20_44_26]